MNKEAIERTKARVKNELKPVLTNGLEMARLEMQSMFARNKQLFDQCRNPNESPINYYIPEPNIWEPLTPKQYLFVTIVALSSIAFFIWWLK